MEKKKEYQLAILSYLNSYSHKFYSDIERDNVKYFDGTAQLKRVFDDMERTGYLSKDADVLLLNPEATRSEDTAPWHIRTDGQLRLLELQHEKKQENKQKTFNNWLMILAAIAAATGLISIFR